VSQSGWKRALKRRLIAGVIVIAPVTATVWVLLWIFQLLDGLLGRFLYPTLSRYVPWIELLPGLGVVVLFLLLFTVGWLAERAVGSRVLSWWHQTLERIPVTRRIYGAANRIVRTILSQDARPFNAVVMIEYPAPGRWSIGFLAADAPHVVRDIVPDSVSVFVPTTPNPTSGWIVVLPRSKVIPLAMTVDQAFTYILSAGAVRPPDRMQAVEAVPAPFAALGVQASDETETEALTGATGGR
jgi:uncharacterized membrane protein